MRAFDVTPGEAPTWPGITTTGRVVAEFLGRVRTTGDAAAAAELMTPRVLCHQVVSEAPVTIERTPAEYAAHVVEMLEAYGRFDFAVTELLCEDDQVYVRWRQTGVDLTPSPAGSPSRRPVVEVGSAVYRVHDGRIAEYWIQLDRHGLLAQLEH